MRTLLLFLFTSVVSQSYAYDGDVFMAETIEGVQMTFKVLSEKDKTCTVYAQGFAEASISKSTEGIITIPRMVNEYLVTRIGAEAFSGCSGLISVEIPSSVTSIESRAFQYCI